MKEQRVQRNLEVQLDANTFVNVGHTFLGWSFDPTSKDIDFQDCSVGSFDSDTDLYAVWEINQYTIFFDVNGGNILDGRESITQDYGSEITAPELNKQGNSFIGWLPEVPSTMPDHDLTCIAQWKINNYPLTISVDEHIDKVYLKYNGSEDWEDISPDHAMDVQYNSQWSIYASAVIGYHVENYDSQETAYTNIKSDNVEEFQIKSKPNTYHVLFDKNSSDATGTMSVQEFNYDEQQQLFSNSFQRDNYIFKYWQTDDEATYADGATVQNLTSDNEGTITLYAIWEKDNTSLITEENDKILLENGEFSLLIEE